jgi:hypothetical protein
VGEAFGKPFKIKFENNDFCDEAPKFTFFPGDLDITIPKTGVATLTAVGEDPEGKLVNIKVETGAASDFVSYSINLDSGTVKFEIDFGAISKEGTSIISVKLIDKGGKSVSNLF